MNLCSDFELKKCSRQGRHRISSLPDDILLHILSFLTLKEVAMTSILSRRWLNLWLHNPVLIFRSPVFVDFQIKPKERRKFVKWVNSVLRVHKGQCLKEFRIFFLLGKHNRKAIDSWLEYALARKVQSLELNFLYSIFPINQDDNYAIRERFLNLSLEKGIQSVDSSSGGSRFPKPDFNFLKSLSLKGVDVTSEAINFFLLNCPYLERLEVAGTLKLVKLVISGPTLVLKYLWIMDCFNLEDLRISNFNLVSLYISVVRGNLTLTNLPMLVELSISGTSVVLSRWFSQTSSCHSQLEALILKTVNLEDIIQLSNVSQMTKVKHLFIEVGALHDESLTKLFSFVNSFPHLVEFVLVMSRYRPDRTSRPLCKGEKCSLECLKVFKFKGYYGGVSDVELIMHVVENAAGLEKVIIDPHAHDDWSDTSASLNMEHEARSVALLQYDGLRESIPAHVDLVIR